MSLANNDRQTVIVATASQTLFTPDFQLYGDSEITVYQTVALTSTTSTLVKTTHYTITESTPGVYPTSFTITLVTGAAVNDKIIIEGTRAVRSDAAFANGGDMRAGTVNKRLDEAAAERQELARMIGQTLSLSPGNTVDVDGTIPPLVANYHLAANDDATGFEWVEPDGNIGGLGTANTLAMFTAAETIGSAPVTVGPGSTYLDFLVEMRSMGIPLTNLATGYIRLDSFDPAGAAEGDGIYFDSVAGDWVKGVIQTLDLASGSAADPSYSFSSFATSGFFAGAGPYIGVAISGVEVARFDSTGLVTTLGMTSLNLSGDRAVAIAGDAITLASGDFQIRLTAETGSTDNLDTITGGTDGDVILLLTDSLHVITLVSGGNIVAPPGHKVSAVSGVWLKRYGSNWRYVGGGVQPLSNIDALGLADDTVMYVASNYWVSGNIPDLSVDLTTDVTGVLPDGNVANDLTIDGGSVDNSPIGAITPSTGVFTTVSVNTSFSLTGTFQINNTQPQLTFVESDAAADNKTWLYGASGEQWGLWALNDLLAANPAWLVDRTGNAIDRIRLYTGGTARVDINAGVTTITSLVATTADIDAGTIDGTNIGASVRGTGAFTTLAANSTTTLAGTTNVSGSLSATNTVTLSPANQTVTISPTGTGTVTIGPATAGSINNINIGATTAGTGRFTTVTTTTSGSSIAQPSFSGVTTGYSSSFAASSDTPGYHKDSNGRVHLRGRINTASATGSTIHATFLPAGSRPSAVRYFQCTIGGVLGLPSASQDCILSVNAAGALSIWNYTNGANDWISLDGISFETT